MSASHHDHARRTRTDALPVRIETADAVVEPERDCYARGWLAREG